MEKMLYRFTKNADQEISISKKKWRGRTYLDIRTLYNSPSGDLIPTKKGVSIPEDDVIEFLKAMDLVREEFYGTNNREGKTSDESDGSR